MLGRERDKSKLIFQTALTKRSRDPSPLYVHQPFRVQGGPNIFSQRVKKRARSNELKYFEQVVRYLTVSFPRRIITRFHSARAE